MEQLQYYVPEHMDSLPRLKARYRVGISNTERCVLWKEILATNQTVDDQVVIDEATLTHRDDVNIDCQNLKFINQCPDEAPEETTRKLQTLIEHYLQQNPTRPYHPRLMHAALPFLAIGLSLEDAYRCFTSFLKIFVPKFFTEDKKVLQLLILYHDPALCYYMDQRGVSPMSYVHDWWSVLFFETCTDLTTVLTLWDNILLAWDPYLYMFISLVLIMRTREQIMAGGAQEIPLLIATTHIGDFTEVSRLVQHALSFSETTPHAFRCQLCEVTHQTPLFFDFLHSHLKTALCLSVGVQDVTTVRPKYDGDSDRTSAYPISPRNIIVPPQEIPLTHSSGVSPSPSPSPTPSPRPSPPSHGAQLQHPHVRDLGQSAHRTHTRKPSSPDDYPKFAQEIYDCRSLREYNCGHLPGSVHLDPEKLLNRLGVPQFSSKHIALLPRAAQSGDEQALILRLLQIGIPYVSCISSGYEVCHTMFKEGRVYLENHNEAGCFVCTGISPPLSSLASLTFTPSHQPLQPLLPPQQLQELQQHQQSQKENEKQGFSAIFTGGKLTQMMKEKSASFVNGSKKLAENVGPSLVNGSKKLAENVGPSFEKLAENVGHINIKSILPNSDKSDQKSPRANEEEVDISGLDSSDYRSLQEWMMYDSNEQFPCKYVKKDGSLHDRRIILSDKEIIILEVNPKNSNYVRIEKTYNLSQLSLITFKKSTPKNLRFKFELPFPPCDPNTSDPSLFSPSPPHPFPSYPSTDFQEIILSPAVPSFPPSFPPPLSPSSTSHHVVKTFFVEEPQPLIAAVHRKVQKL